MFGQGHQNVSQRLTLQNSKMNQTSIRTFEFYDLKELEIPLHDFKVKIFKVSFNKPITFCSWFYLYSKVLSRRFFFFSLEI